MMCGAVESSATFCRLARAKNVMRSPEVSLPGFPQTQHVRLCGYPPFYGDQDPDILRMVKKGNFTFPPEDLEDLAWKGV